ncbi:hypothetical protein ILUMI_06137 [Ignelater luminosus]|uniref:Uncharacterized protein n=1 Tax=Ignelater luminosus TaxID=2038154 RepID=A0A8K0D602_IGNLU|nr:hypothetical protein ILUMI_06137 [Ignelater luminosus]
MVITRLTKISLVISTFVFVTNGNSLLNNNCDYSLHHQIITCVNIDFKNAHLEYYITNDTHVLIIKECSNLEIPSNYHDGNSFRHITSYQLVNNGIITIDSFAFDKLSDLRYLKIDNNKNWLSLKANTFAGLEKLEMLSIVNNSMQTLENDAFKGLKDLDVLDLRYNQLTVIPSSIFKPLQRLTSLFLPQNNIHTLEQDCFEGLVKVELIDITFNNLETINPRTFNSLTRLSDLYLSNNKISQIGGTFSLPNLKFLYLQYNNLNAIDKDTFSSILNLQAIDLSNNKINIIADDEFYNLKHLHLINLRNNSASSFSNLRFSSKPVIVV